MYWLFDIIIDFLLFFGVFYVLGKAVKFTGKKTVHEKKKEWFITFLLTLIAFIILKILWQSPFKELV